MTRVAWAAAPAKTAGSTMRLRSRPATCTPLSERWAPTRVVIAVGEESLGTFTGRTSLATAELLGQRATVFPSHHGGFLGGESGYAGQPKAFARRLREVLNDDN